MVLMNLNPLETKDILPIGLKKGWGSFLWIIKILLPISFLTALLGWSGWIHQIDFLFRPLMGLLNLPPMAAFPIGIGMITGIYGGLAAMVALPFSKEQMTLIAVFMMIAHSLIAEGAIQGKAGLHPLKATFFRIAVAVLAVLAIAPFFDSGPNLPAAGFLPITRSRPFGEFLRNWSLSTLYLALRIFVIILGISILMELLRARGRVSPIARNIAPLARVMGLSERAAFAWVTAALFGLIYSSAIILEESKEEHYTKEELERLHFSTGIHHAVIEDPLLFTALGLSAFWMWVPRLIAAILTPRIFTFIEKRYRAFFRQGGRRLFPSS
jgi:hypothetical protein